mgnify:CR=1 FL=1
MYNVEHEKPYDKAERLARSAQNGKLTKEQEQML